MKNYHYASQLENMATAKVVIPKDANYSTEEKVHACNSRGYIYDILCIVIFI